MEPFAMTLDGRVEDAVRRIPRGGLPPHLVHLTAALVRWAIAVRRCRAGLIAALDAERPSHGVLVVKVAA